MCEHGPNQRWYRDLSPSVRICGQRAFLFLGGMYLNKHDVFISYKSEEYTEASWVKAVLEENGFTCWMAPASIPGGSSYADEIYEAISSCGVFVLILSSHAQNSIWIKKELDIALNTKKVILPFAIEDCKLQNAFNLYLTDVQRYYAYESRVTAIQQMIQRIRSVINADGSISTKVPNISVPQQTAVDSKGGKHYLGMAILIAVYFLGLLLPLFLYLMKQKFNLFLRIVYFIWILCGILWFQNRIETHPKLAGLCFGTIKESDLSSHPKVIYSNLVSVFGNKPFISDKCPEGFVSYYTLRLIEFGSWDGEKVNYLKIHFKPGFEYYDPSVLYLHTLSRGSQAVKMLIRQGFVLSPPPNCFPQNTVYLNKGDLHICLYHKKRALRGAIIYHCPVEDIQNHYQGEWNEKESFSE